MVSGLDPQTTRPGLQEQYKINLQRFEPGGGSPGCEFISFPGYLSGPSASLSLSLYLSIPSYPTPYFVLTRQNHSTDPPEPGKRYATILVAVNHCFSRGTIVCTFEFPRSFS